MGHPDLSCTFPVEGMYSEVSGTRTDGRDVDSLNPNCCCTPAWVMNRRSCGGTSQVLPSQTVQMEPTSQVLTMAQWRLRLTSFYDD